MSLSEKLRYDSTVQDLLALQAGSYCDLGPGAGEIVLGLKKHGQKVSCVEAPWHFEDRTAWCRENAVEVHKGEFFSTDFNGLFNTKVGCFSLVHAIAHFRFPPQILLQKVFDNLESGGYFYLSTVNGGSLDRILALARGKAITEKVEWYVDMGDEYREHCNPTGKYMIWDSWMHVKEYRDYELRELFEEVGFEVTELFHRNNFKHWKTELACRLWPHMAEEIVIIGQKP